MAVFSKLVFFRTAVAVVGVAAVAVWFLRKRKRPRRPRVYLCSVPADWDEVAEDFRKSLSEGLLGVDCEWVTTQTGAQPVALLQMAPTTELCVLIRLCLMEAPEEVKQILADHTIVKFGVAILDDAKLLYKDYGIKVNFSTHLFCERKDRSVKFPFDQELEF